MQANFGAAGMSSKTRQPGRRIGRAGPSVLLETIFFSDTVSGLNDTSQNRQCRCAAYAA
jgi:hypothetical protein